MSIETILFLAFFLLVPLIERLIRAQRERQPAEEERQAPPALPRPERQPRRREPAIEARGPLEGVPTPAAPAGTRGERAPQRYRRDARAEISAGGQRPQAKPRTPPALAGLRNRRELRRAVVLMTILGPCRAVEADAYQPTKFLRRSQ